MVSSRYSTRAHDEHSVVQSLLMTSVDFAGVGWPVHEEQGCAELTQPVLSKQQALLCLMTSKLDTPMCWSIKYIAN